MDSNNSRVEFNCAGGIKLVYDYAELEAQQMAMAQRVVEFRLMQDQSTARPASLAQFVESDGTFYKERTVAYLVRRYDENTLELKDFNSGAANSSYFNMLKSLRGEEVAKLDVVLEHFFTKRGKTSLLSLMDSGAELRAMVPMAQQLMRMEVAQGPSASAAEEKQNEV